MHYYIVVALSLSLTSAHGAMMMNEWRVESRDPSSKFCALIGHRALVNQQHHHLFV